MQAAILQQLAASDQDELANVFLVQLLECVLRQGCPPYELRRRDELAYAWQIDCFGHADCHLADVLGDAGPSHVEEALGTTLLLRHVRVGRRLRGHVALEGG